MEARGGVPPGALEGGSSGEAVLGKLRDGRLLRPVIVDRAGRQKRHVPVSGARHRRLRRGAVIGIVSRVNGCLTRS